VADTLQSGDSGPEVAELQQWLVNLGYHVEVNSQFDEYTLEAVKSYQQYCSVEVTGIADATTLSYVEAHANTAAQSTYHQDGYDGSYQ